mmetsp:Transcript_22437/g.69604  ORF Transcript_22437/g.69604 Transcript_22437/m.69604 type:complete len:247 (-) Transcript_22437:501-1241(-)
MILSSATPVTMISTSTNWTNSQTWTRRNRRLIGLAKRTGSCGVVDGLEPVPLAGRFVCTGGVSNPAASTLFLREMRPLLLLAWSLSRGVRSGDCGLSSVKVAVRSIVRALRLPRPSRSALVCVALEPCWSCSSSPSSADAPARSERFSVDSPWKNLRSGRRRLRPSCGSLKMSMPSWSSSRRFGHECERETRCCDGPVVSPMRGFPSSPRIDNDCTRPSSASGSIETPISVSDVCAPSDRVVHTSS